MTYPKACILLIFLAVIIIGGSILYSSIDEDIKNEDTQKDSSEEQKEKVKK